DPRDASEHPAQPDGEAGDQALGPPIFVAPPTRSWRPHGVSWRARSPVLVDPTKTAESRRLPPEPEVLNGLARSLLRMTACSGFSSSTSRTVPRLSRPPAGPSAPGSTS